MRISIFGLGYVGSVSAAGFASLGHTVVGVDTNKDKVELINRGNSPVVEPGLDQLIKTAVREKRLTATDDYIFAVENSEVAIICVGTPSDNNTGGMDGTALERVISQIGKALAYRRSKNKPPSYFVVINRSTTLPDYHKRLVSLLEETSDYKVGEDIDYVYHPEFLREGSGLEDFFDPIRLVFGIYEEKTKTVCERLYPNIDADCFYLLPEEASMVKYADNLFHALKITFANEIGLICSPFGIDSRLIMDVVCRDTRLNISPRYLKPGPPFGGSCLPKDLLAVLDLARRRAVDLPMLKGLNSSNNMQLERICRIITSHAEVGSKVGLIGLTFKETTDDLRGSPMVKIAEHLIGKGYDVRIFDRNLSFERLVGANKAYLFASLPHISRLISYDLGELVRSSSLIVVAHRLKADIWQDSGIMDRKGLKIIDLLGVSQLEDHPGYIGLYW